MLEKPERFLRSKQTRWDWNIRSHLVLKSELINAERKESFAMEDDLGDFWCNACHKQWEFCGEVENDVPQRFAFVWQMVCKRIPGSALQQAQLAREEFISKERSGHFFASQTAVWQKDGQMS